MTKILKHNNRDVRVTFNSSLIEILRGFDEMGICPYELPINSLSIRVFRYIDQGQKKYLVYSRDTSYAVDEIPEDGWQGMIDDISMQLCAFHEPPEKEKNRFEILYERYQKEAKNIIYRMFPGDEAIEQMVEDGLESFPEYIQKCYWCYIARWLEYAGYDRETINYVQMLSYDLELFYEVLSKANK